MDSVRINYNKCGEQSFASFIKNISKRSDFTFKAHNPADQSVMQDRYTYTKNRHRVSIVYETKAQTLVITAPKIVIGDVTALLPSEISGQINGADNKPAQREDAKTDSTQKILIREQKKSAKQEAKPQSQPKQDKGTVKPQSQPKQDKGTVKPQSQPKQDKGTVKPQSQPKQDKGTVKPQSQSKQDKKADGKSNNIAAKEDPKSKQTSQKQNTKAGTLSNTNTAKKQANKDIKTSGTSYLIKKVTDDRFSELLKKIKANKNMRYKLTFSDNEAKVYSVTSGREKAVLKYNKGDLQLSGSRGDLYSELQLMISQTSDYKTAIKTHIKFSGEEKRANDVERQLKKKLPAAFEFLSEQSKIDLAIGIIDINNSAVVLSDYSTLLIPCFRGLERLIFDLQHAQGIVVKMIGQAYEKEDGSYVLKSGYRRKIPSVIYAEVMAALYTEYFKQRNFYAHSDGGYDNVSRVISDKQQVQNIFNHIMDVINYNGKKLKEIGFRI